jgi:hypothetical protein
MLKFKDFLKESKSEYLYHATYRIHKPSIKKHGLKTDSEHKNWEDSESGKIYLSTKPEVAKSHAETSDAAPEEHYNSGIVVYKVQKKNLSQKHINLDKNVQDNDGSTVEYSKNIPREHLSIHSEHDT